MPHVTILPLHLRNLGASWLRVGLPLACLLLVVALGGGASPAAARPRGEGQPVTVAFLGDSLTAGVGLDPGLAYPALVSACLETAGISVRVLNAGVSGDTTGQGLARLQEVLASKPAMVVIALGTNDALRGLDPAEMEANLEAMVTACQAHGAVVLVLGMRFTTWLPEPLAARYEAIYPRIAERHGLPLVPFMLQGVAGVPALNFPDGLHPNVSGQCRVADLVCPAVEKLLLKVVKQR
jgi:acyl-CoA thioesterase-1